MRIQIDPSFKSLAAETRTALPTDAAAHHINRKPQTLRAWACRDDGPIQPIRIHGRLAWRVSDPRALLDGSTK
jgi:hypothetical protein